MYPIFSQYIALPTSVTNKVPAPKDMDTFRMITLSCLGGLVFFTIIIVAFVAYQKGLPGLFSKDHYEEEIFMHDYSNKGYDPYNDDGFDPFEGTQKPAITRPNGLPNGNITWVNDNYGFL